MIEATTTLALKQLNLTKNDETGCFEVALDPHDWQYFEGVQDIFFMDEHTAVATLVLCYHERNVDYLVGEPALAKLDTAG